MFILKHKFSFEAAHFIPGYKGECGLIHGHSFHVEIAVKGEDSSLVNGMLIDFNSLKEFSKEIKILYDHAYLNSAVNFYPTAENIAFNIYERLSNYLTNDLVSAYYVDVNETDGNCAEYRIQE